MGKDDLYTTTEMHRELTSEGYEASLEEIEESFYNLEEAGIIEHAGTTDDGDDLWRIKSLSNALMFMSKMKASKTVSTWKDRFFAPGDDTDD